MRYFTERLGAELSLRGGGRGRVSLILLSIDRLKELNDNYGTPLGDYTLSEIATLIRLLLPANTLLARFERDAFVIMVCDRGEAELRRLAGKLMSAVAASSFTYGGTVHRVTLSIGIVTSRGEEASLLIQRADNTLFEAKEEGGNSVCAHC
ncbi:MAG: GGDEF domain-containing protein [Candidatus Aureabacteria bacterium]|nr:GGDEF domain-containing protein [Candidatus Auribacterota bacterium]